MKETFRVVRVLLAAIGIAILGAIPASVTHPVHAAIDVPVEIEISTEETTLAPGLDSDVHVAVRATDDLQDVVVHTWTKGKARISKPPAIDRASVAAGESIAFDVPVGLDEPGESSVVVEVRARIASSEFTFSKQAVLNILLRDDRAFTGMLDMTSLKRSALNHDLLAGRVGNVAADARLRELNAVDTVEDHSVPEREPLNERVAALRVEPAPAPTRNQKWVDDEPAFPSQLGTNINVSGTVRYVDENGTGHPVFGYAVEVRDDDLFGSDLLANVATAPDGTYNVTVDSDDPNGPDIFVRFRPENSLIEVRPLGGGSYENETDVVDDVGANTSLVFNITFAATVDGPVGSVLSGMTYAAVYARDVLNAGVGLAQIPVEFPGSTGAAFYDGSLINIRPNDRFDWDVMHHEFGHYVQDSFNFENSPGGAHNIGECLSVTQGGLASPSKDSGLRLAWGEAWPTFFGTSLQREFGLGATEAPRIGDTVYADTVDGFDGFSYSLEVNSNTTSGVGDTRGLGEDNEVAIQRIIWDLYDSSSDSRDTLSNDDLALFNVFRNTNAQRFTTAWALLRASGLVPDNETDLDAGGIATDHAVGPQPLSPGADTIVTSSNASFAWTRAVGCSTNFDGDTFNLRFYDADTFANLLTLPGLNSTTANLTQSQILSLTASNHDVFWAVEGSTTNNTPTTGPYLGARVAVVVNTPPVADAGTGRSVECTSPTTTPVMLNGSGSSDEDGDSLTYSWSVPGVVFGDPNAQDPTGQFPLGNTVTTLTVSDDIQQDSDTVTIEVVDSSAPAIGCPADVVVECSATGGTPADDPQLEPFFAGASATDVCDDTPSIFHDAPAFFPKTASPVTVHAEAPRDDRDSIFTFNNTAGGAAANGSAAVYVLGTTPVTFTASDDNGNEASCSASVDVVDTTPPAISLPPDIVVECEGPAGAEVDVGFATATDICCDFVDDPTNDAPQVFGIGDNDVVWTTEDCHGNPATDVQRVTVLDPPRYLSTAFNQLFLGAHVDQQNLYWVPKCTSQDVELQASFLPPRLGLDAIDVLRDGDHLFSVASNGVVHTPAGWLYLRQDRIYRYNPGSESITLELDLQAMGLAVRTVDALDMLEDGSYAFSTKWSRVFEYQDELLRIRPQNVYRYEPGTGAVTIVFDGEDLGLHSLDAVDVFPSGVIAFSTETNESVLDPGGVLHLKQQNIYLYDPATKTVSRDLVDAVALGLSSLDALALGGFAQES